MFVLQFQVKHTLSNKPLSVKNVMTGCFLDFELSISQCNYEKHNADFSLMSSMVNTSVIERRKHAMAILPDLLFILIISDGPNRF